MRIVLGMTIHNEIEYGPHIWQQLEHSLSIDYDDIVLLDDGSTDGTWDVIQEYAAKDNRVHAFRNPQNSILSRGTNRWLQLWQHMSKYNPTWVNIRACDQICSKELRDDFRQIVEKFHPMNVNIVMFPLAHLWRSMYWYRSDHVWGKEASGHPKLQLIRYHKDWNFSKQFHMARFHQGRHIPVFPGNDKRKGVNFISKPQDDGKHIYTVLHLGHSSHEKKVAKFRWTMEASSRGIAINSPGPKNMPSVGRWLQFSGIKGFYEFCIELKRAPQYWFDEEIPPDLQEPEFRSFYPIIKEYNPGRAEEYQKRFDQFLQRRFKEGKQIVVRVPPVKVVMDQVADETTEENPDNEETDFPKCDNQRKVQGPGPAVNANFKPPRFYKKVPRSN